MTSKQELIAKINIFFVDKPISKAYLFGSYARNEQTQESDVDILVDFEKQANLFDLIGLQQNLSELLNLKVDLLSSKGVSKFMLPYIEKDKVLIYER
jgi:predicted nucleotidyltransferase